MLQLMWRQDADVVPSLEIDETRLIDAAVELFLAAIQSPRGS
jgi:hypothetical protein